MNTFFSFLIVALKIRKQKVQLEVCENKENESDAPNEQKESTQTNNVTAQMKERNLSTETNTDGVKKNPEKKTRARTEKRPPNQIRYSSGNHTKETTDVRVRCKMEKCKYKSNIMCAKCNVHLCATTRDCFADFHNIEKS